MKLFEKIRILRKERGMSQEQLGYSLSRVNKDGVSRQTISDWENGNFEPKLDNIRDLADVFDVSFDALLDESVDLDDKEVLKAVLNKNDLGSIKNTTNKSKENKNDKLIHLRDGFAFVIMFFVFDWAINILMSIIGVWDLNTEHTSSDYLGIVNGALTIILCSIALIVLIYSIVRKKAMLVPVILISICLLLNVSWEISNYKHIVDTYTKLYEEYGFETELVLIEINTRGFVVYMIKDALFLGLAIWSIRDIVLEQVKNRKTELQN